MTSIDKNKNLNRSKYEFKKSYSIEVILFNKRIKFDECF